MNERLYASLIGTQVIRFRRKKNEIAKFNILDEKETILDKIWTKNSHLIVKKLSLFSENIKGTQIFHRNKSIYGKIRKCSISLHIYLEISTYLSFVN